MKKTITITLSHTLFHIEEDAYERLSTYLESVKKHFASNADKDEIMSDIENRIAEQFSENGSKDKIVTLAQVHALIASMGNVKDFDDEHTSTTDDEQTPEKNIPVHKKLFRNPDDTVIAGVASGLAVYFGIDPIIMRLIFILVLFAGGSAILIYIILWLIMPVAHTSTEKLQMKGERITLETVSETVKEKVSEVRSHRGTFHKLISLPFLIVGRIIKVLIPVIGKIIGLILIIGAACALFALTFAFALALFNIQSPYVDFPLLEMGTVFSVYIGLVAGFCVLLVPLIFLLSIGRGIFSRKTAMRSTTAISLLGLWAVALVCIGVVSAKVVPEYRNFMMTSPEYRETTQTFPLADFSHITAENGSVVSIAEGPEFSISATGNPRSLGELSLRVENDTLYVSKTNFFRICIFCARNTPTITVTLPSINSISAENGSRIDAKATSTNALTVRLSNGSQAELFLDIHQLTLDQSNASWSWITGTSTTANITLKNASRVRGSDWVIDGATVSAENASRADLHVEKTLNAKLQNGSLLRYTGSPETTENVRNSSRLEKIGGEL